MSRHSRALVAVVAAALLVACAGAGEDASEERASAPTVPATTAGRSRAERDGELRIGALLPLDGDGAVTGRPMLAGVEMAVRDINASGGVQGRPVVVVAADEGQGADRASVGLNRLVTDEHVDGVVGPATSRTTLALLDELRRVAMPSCSPGATAIALTADPDGGVFVRTIGSDLLEGTAVGQVIADTGRSRVAVLAPDDDYGSGLTDAITAELTRQGVGVVAALRYRPDAVDPSDTVREALAFEPDAIAVVGMAESGGRLLSALAAAGVQPGSDAGETLVVVTDGLRGQRVTAGVWGVAPSTVPGSEQGEFADALGAYAPGVALDYAAYAYDCAILLALAAQSGDGPIMKALLEASRAGERCDSFARCAALLADGRDIDYAGSGGQMDLTATGDADRGVYDVFVFNADGSTTVRARPVVRLP